MKKYILFTLLIISVFQVTAQFKLGAFGAKNEQVDKYGLGINSEFFLSKKFSISTDVIVYFNSKKDYYSGGTFHQADLFVNMNYYFLRYTKIDIYGIGGLNLHLHRRIDEQYGNSNDFSGGLNTGLGVLAKFKNIQPFAEIQYTTDFVELFAYANFTTKIGFKINIKK